MSVNRIRDCGASICFFQAEDGIRDLVRSRGLGDVYKRQLWGRINYTSKPDDAVLQKLATATEQAINGSEESLSLIHI